MTNIYQPPESEVSQSDSVDLRRSQKILCTLMSFFPAFLYGVPHRAIPQFGETFASFGADLSGLTILIIDIHPIFYWLGIFSLLPLLVWLGAVCHHFYCFLVGNVFPHLFLGASDLMTSKYAYLMEQN